MFVKFPKYYMNILLGYFKVDGNENSHKISNVIGVRIGHFATAKNLTVESTMYLDIPVRLTIFL
jgi:hypothetical protein